MARSLDGATDFRDWPVINQELLTQLQARFPERCIGEKESPEEAHRYAGKVEMIRFLELVSEAQHGD